MAIITQQQTQYSILGGKSRINNSDLYIFSTTVLEPICEKYFKYGGIKAAVKTKASKGTGKSGLHRAAFTVTATSLQLGESAKEKFSVLCKIYRKNSVNDEISIDFEAIMGGYYKYFATVIENAVYYLRYDDILRYQQEMGNSCATRDGKFIKVNAQYWIDEAEYRAEISAEDLATYDRGYEKYVH